MRYIFSIICVVVVSAMIIGFFVIGSPFEARVKKIDEMRVQHLQYIQSMVIDYWINKQRLPSTLTLLNDTTRGVLIPQDPETKEPYRYTIKDTTHFTLCATFNRTTNDTETKSPIRTQPVMPWGAGIGVSWRHDAGKFCFDRSIDPDFYKPLPKPIYD